MACSTVGREFFKQACHPAIETPLDATTDFIAELFRAANEIERLDVSEKDKLLQRAVSIIRDMRAILSIPSSCTSADILIGVADTANRVGSADNTEISRALLQAAGMNRDLRIVMDSR